MVAFIYCDASYESEKKICSVFSKIIFHACTADMIAAITNGHSVDRVFVVFYIFRR
jgi:hypothetical protein